MLYKFAQLPHLSVAATARRGAATASALSPGQAPLWPSWRLRPLVAAQRPPRQCLCFAAPEQQQSSDQTRATKDAADKQSSAQCRRVHDACRLVGIGSDESTYLVCGMPACLHRRQLCLQCHDRWVLSLNHSRGEQPQERAQGDAQSTQQQQPRWVLSVEISTTTSPSQMGSYNKLSAPSIALTARYQGFQAAW